MSRAFRYQQPVDNNMDYGSAEMLADERRMIRENAEPRILLEDRPMARRPSGGAPPHNLKGITQHGSLTHSKANSSFVTTPATHLGKPGGLRKGYRGRGK